MPKLEESAERCFVDTNIWLYAFVESNEVEKRPVAKAVVQGRDMASELREKYSLSFWDSLIVASALWAECSILYTEDMQHGLKVEEKLTVLNPFKVKKHR